MSRDKLSSKSPPVIDTVSKDAPPDKVWSRLAERLGDRWQEACDVTPIGDGRPNATDALGTAPLALVADTG